MLLLVATQVALLDVSAQAGAAPPIGSTANKAFHSTLSSAVILLLEVLMLPVVVKVAVTVSPAVGASVSTINICSVPVYPVPALTF